MRAFLVCTLFFTFLFSLSEKDAIFQIHSQLLIRDHLSAQRSAEQALAMFPDSKEVRSILIRILAETGQEMEAFRHWQKLEGDNKATLEALAWGILEKASGSEQLNVHLSSIFGASQTQDVRAVHLLQRQLRSSNAYVRAMSVNFAMRFGDDLLVQELVRMLDSETVWYARLEVIKALAQFKVQSILPKLQEIVGSDRATIEEKFVAIQAMASMMESINPAELEALISSPRAGLRQLACQLILHLDLVDERERLVTALDDTSNEVKCAALCALGYLGADGLDLSDKLLELRESSNDRIAIAAGWLSLFVDKSAGYKTLYEYASHPDPDVRRLSAAAIGAAGENGVLLAKKLLSKSSDPYVRLNAALALIGEEPTSSCREIDRFLTENSEMLMEEEFPGLPFTAVSPSQVRHVPQIVGYPHMIDQSTRLGMYSALAVARYPNAINSIKKFLGQQTMGIPFMAAQVLLREGGGEAYDLIRELLKDPNEKIRLQAAIVLAIANPEDDVLAVIEKTYPNVDRQYKMQIIEALGYFGSESSIPFLVKRLSDPYSVLRIASASAIIRSLNH